MTDIPKPKPPAVRPFVPMELSPMEYHYGFQNDTFRAYMLLFRSNGGRDVMENCLDELAGSSNPLLQNAAGSAALELALRRPRKEDEAPPQEQFAERQELLAIAKTQHNEAADGLFEWSKKITDDQPKSLSLEQCGIQALHTSAYVPLMELAAARYVGYYLTPEEIESRQLATRQATMYLSEFLLNTEHTGYGQIAGVGRGLIGEVACGLVGQAGDPAGALVLPSSLRQDNRRQRKLRADFMGIHAEEPYSKTMIQVKYGHNMTSEESDCLLVQASRDLVLEPGLEVDYTLQSFIDMVQGTASSEIEERFRAVNQTLVDRIESFDMTARQKKMREEKSLDPGDSETLTD